MSGGDGEDEFPDEHTDVDGVVELAQDVPTQPAPDIRCWHCGLEHIPGKPATAPCEHCRRVPALAKARCLGHGGRVLWLPAMARYPAPRTFDEAIKLARGRCVACPTYWVCAVAPGAWSG